MITNIKPVRVCGVRSVQPCPRCGMDNLDGVFIVLPETTAFGNFTRSSGDAHVECGSCGRRGAPQKYDHSVDYEGRRRVWRSLVRDWNRVARREVEQ